MTGTVEIFTTEGDLLASAQLPAELFIEGEDGSIKEHSLSMPARIDGTAARYRFTSPAGEAHEGEVREGKGAAVHFFTIDRVSLSANERINATIKARTVKEN